MLRKTSLLCLLLASSLLCGGCCTRERCETKFDCVDCTREECLKRYPPPMPPDGPDVIVGPGDGNSISWTIDGQDSTDGGSVFPSCRLRKDFIGFNTNHLKYRKKNQTNWTGATVVEMESATILLRYKRGSWGGLDWWIRNKSTNQSCTLTQGPIPATATDIPTEFRGFVQTDRFQEATAYTDASHTNFQVEY